MLLSALVVFAAAAQTAVKIELTIDASGTATSCAVVESNAPPELTEATCRTTLQRARFQPRRDASGAPVESKTVMTVRYAVPPAGPANT